ncbi:oxygenase MpaB family protein [Nocardioides sp.]|uniref:oxygenase MpaB family protein n=1 Tax=Nocardioides sp. TaxID=35761 RepID=UPI00356A57E5
MTPDGRTSLRERLGHALFLRVAGPDGAEHRNRIHGTPGPRWFAPDSAIVRVHGDASMFIGGIRALFLQTLHPAAMTAVSEHSGFRGDMWGRLARTSRFLAVTTFGTADDAQQAVDVVRSIHHRITGVMPDGTPYAASDPHLLGWVHVAQVDSFLLAHQTYGARPLDQAGRDEYVAQAAEVARRLGVLDPPTTEAELAAALAAYRPELRGTPQAREAIAYLLFRPPLPVLARAPYGVLMAGAVGLMPAWTRRPLGLPLLPIAERTVVRTLGSLATRTIRWAMSPGREEVARLRVSAPSPAAPGRSRR